MPLDAIEEKVCRAVAARATVLLDDLRLHVGLPTGGGNAAALDESRERLMERLRATGAVAEIVPGEAAPEWLHARREGDGGAGVPPTAVCRRVVDGVPGVLLAGHLDTVHDPGSAFRELSIAPEGKTATGPGCVDMKGGLVIAMAALEVLEEVGERVSWSFLLNSDEETGSYHSAGAIAAEAGSGRYAAGIALEPATADGGLVIERGGSGQFLLEAEGRAAHVGRDFFGGVSAVVALAERIVEVSRISDAGRGLVANVGPLEGGTTTNTVPERARAWGNVRFRDHEGEAELVQRLEELATSGDGLPRVRVRHSFNRPAKPLTPGTERLALLARSCAEDLGQRLPFGKTGGVCDGNNMQAAGLPSIDTLGVRGGGLHTPQEWIEVPSLVERCQLLALVMRRVSEAAF